MLFASPMLHHAPWSPTWEGKEPRGQPIHLGWDGDTIPVYSYKEYDSEPLQILLLITQQSHSDHKSYLSAQLTPAF